jgi:hypothetical protein
VTASFGALTWLPVSATGPGFECKKRRSAHFPALSGRVAQRTKINVLVT